VNDELSERFDCFGSSCALLLSGGPSPREALAQARALLFDAHARLSRFDPASELSRLNDDPRGTVPVSPLLARLAQAVIDAARATGGLVDATQVRRIERAGYVSDLGEPLELRRALARAGVRRAATPDPHSRWRAIAVDIDGGTVTRPPGVMIDSGGLAKGLLADQLGAQLASYRAFAVDCGGDLAIGGAGGGRREIAVESPFDGRPLHTFSLARTGVATSGIGRRSWLDAAGRPAHHLLDPASGLPAFTGVVQATALAPSALQAEIAAKAAVLSGPRAARAWLRHGGVLVFDDGSHEVVQPPPALTLGELAASARRHPIGAAHADAR
jgi:thiamine biosynthesis lipoprotein